MPKLKTQTRQMQAEKLARALLSGKTRSEAASSLGISESTLDRWLSHESFPGAFDKERKKVLPLLASRIHSGLERAVETLSRNAVCGQPQVEVRAATELVDILLRIEEHIEFSERLSRLESRQDERLNAETS